jgi:hypothetical protein
MTCLGYKLALCLLAAAAAAATAAPAGLALLLHRLAAQSAAKVLI